MNSKVIHIDHDRCLSCYRCISECPVKFCNDASEDIIIIHPEICINCGKCVSACTHNARSILDDADIGISLIEKGKNVVVLMDSTINSSFTNKVSEITGVLKKNPDTKVVDISFGYNLCAKSYAEYLDSLQENKPVITSTCPVIVNYIELYKPELLSFLAPVDSAVGHAVKILKNSGIAGGTADFVYLSPCIAKKQEFRKLINNEIYNLTFRNLTIFLESQEIATESHQDLTPDNLDNDTPGIVENTSVFEKEVRRYTTRDFEYRKITGIREIIKYLQGLTPDKLLKEKPLLIDLLSCKHGCDGGSGALAKEDSLFSTYTNTISYYRDIIKKSHRVMSAKSAIDNFFRKSLFTRTFKDRSSFNWIEHPDTKQMENIYVAMYKNGHNDIKNCSSCGYNECSKMAVAIHNNLNKTGNCHFFLHQKLSYLAYHDDITGLLNRTAFHARLEETLLLENKFNIANNKTVIITDIYGFREINDTLGNEVGNELLLRTATRLRAILKEGDQLFRTGSDEFAIILNYTDNNSDYPKILNDIHDVFTASFNIEGNELFITVNCGVSMYPFDGNTASKIIKNAETALYEAKVERKDFVRFSDHMHTKAIEKLNLITSLRNALDKDEFELYYQPQYSSSGKLMGAEALIRWIKPDFGMIAPDKFIPLAEDSGLIVPIGEWVIDRVCQDYLKMTEAGFDISISANLSVRQFKDKELVNKIEKMVKKYGIEKDKMHLEITESFIMDHGKESLDKLKKLSDLGLRISLDDFGTGYSCLSYLNHLSLNSLKIDKSFVDQISETSETVPLVDTIVSMAMGLGLDVVAEGVSEMFQVNYFKKFEYEIIMQGFFFSKPLPFKDFMNLTK